MKKIGSIIILTLGAVSLSAQEFSDTEKYRLTEKRATKEQQDDAYTVILETAGAEPEQLTELAIADRDFFETAHLSSMVLPGLEGIREVVKIDLVYAVCRIPLRTYYILVSEEGPTVDFPMVSNSHCNIWDGEVRYIFPNESYGEEGMVQKTKVYYSKEGTIQNKVVLQRFYWDDDAFGNQGPLTASGDSES